MTFHTDQGNTGGSSETPAIAAGTPPEAAQTRVPREGSLLDDRYLLGALLKQGGGIGTHLGTDQVSGEPVVVKVTDPAAAPAVAKIRLEREAEALARIRSPHVAPLLRVDVAGDRLFLVMPRVPGTTLAERLAKGSLPLREAVAVGSGMLAGLKAAHEQGILHGDVKPANVLVEGEGSSTRATLVDFGLSRLLRRGAGSEGAAGTARYVSPEQAGLLAQDPDERSDLYSAGIVLYECLAGRPPFAAATLREVLLQHLNFQPPALREARPDVPQCLDEVVQRLLRKDPNDRYQTADAAAADLLEIGSSLDRGVAEPVIVVGQHDRRACLTQPAFVGRSAEISRLEQELARARAGKGRLVLLEAESGGGKTWLLDEFARRATRRGARIFRGQGLDQAAQRPFQLLVGVAADILAASRLAPGWTRRLESRFGTAREAACDALPELSEILGPRSGSIPWPEAFGEVRSLEALAALLDGLGEAAAPAVVLLDDSQWLDGQTCRLLGHWQSLALRNRHTLIVAAYRTEEVGPNHPLTSLTEAERLVLPPLGPHDLGALAESMAGPLPAEAIAVVVRLAEGSPFMAEAALRGLAEGGALVPGSEGWKLDPHVLSQVQSSRQAASLLARRVERLPDRTRRLLAVGAVLGKTLDLEAISTLARVSVAEAIDGLEAAWRRHMVWENPDLAGYRFVHDKIRETCLAMVPEAERRDLHRQAADLLEGRYPPSAYDLAHHLDSAGQAARALSYALAAANDARARHALDIATRFFRIALRGVSDADTVTRFQIAEGLGTVLMLQGQYDEAAERFDQAASLASTVLDRARIAARRGELAFKRSDADGAIARLEEGLRLLGTRPPRGRAGFLAAVAWEGAVQVAHSILPRLLVQSRHSTMSPEESLTAWILSRLAYACWFARGTLPSLWAHLREMNLAERYQPGAELAQAYSEHAPAMSIFGAFERGLRYARRSLEIRRELGDVWGQGQSLNFIGNLLHVSSRFAEALEASREALRLLERTGDRWEENMARFEIAYALYRQGDLAAAAQAGREVYQAGKRLGDSQATAFGVSAWVKATGGRVPADFLDRDLIRPFSDTNSQVEMLNADAILLLAQSRHGEAVTALEEARRIVQRSGLRRESVAPVFPWLATALRLSFEATPPLAPGRRRALLGRARRAAREAVRMARTFRNNLPHALREQGLLEGLRGRPRTAARLLDESLAIAERQGAHCERARSLVARLELGVALANPGAPEALEAARQNLQTLEAAAIAEAGVPSARQEDPTLSLADRFDAVLDCGRRISSSLTGAAVFAAVRHAAAILLRAERSFVLEVVPSPETPAPPAPPAQRPAPPEPEFRLAPEPEFEFQFEPEFRPAPGYEPVSFSLTLARHAVASGRPVVLVDEPSGFVTESVALGDLRSALCAPIFVRNEPVACLYATHAQVGGLFGREEERLAEFVATIAGSALENAAAIAEVQALSRTLESRVEERTAELSRSNAQLAAANAQLEEADQLKDQFVSMVSHELRTPLQGIIGYAHLLGDEAFGPLAAKQHQAVRTVLDCSQTLLSLINELLDYASLQAGRLSVQPEPFFVEEAVEDAIEALRPLAETRGIRLSACLPDELPRVLADPRRLCQAVLNLVANALKFTPPGGSIEAGATLDGDHVRLFVSDTGVGIPPEAMRQVFEPFVQLRNDTALSTGGTGLGLTITKRLVELQGGEIRVESEVGRGSTFSLLLPLWRDPAALEERL